MSLLKGKTFSFRLEFNGKTVGEVISSRMATSELTIGRDAQCSLRIPSEDRSASGVHAKIFRKGRSFFIKDLNSRNGIYFMGAKIQEHKLASDELYSIGNCKLIVEKYHAEDIKSAGQEQYHKLEQLTGQDRGKIYQLTEEKITIGAADDNTIQLNDSLVSQHHAFLKNHPDGTCWIQYLQNRNGTKVNGTLLTEENKETGRMLKDGDIISIAYLDFRFWDKSTVHIRSHLFLKIGVVAATLAIVIGGYFAFQTISPSAKSLRLKAEAAASRGNFDAAKAILQSATTARGAESDSVQRLDLMRKLRIWQETLGTWIKIQKLLSGTPEDGDLYDANDLFANLSSADRERWQWNVSNASVEMKRAQDTHALLSALLGAEDRMRQAEEDISYIGNTRAKLAKALADCRKNPQPYQAVIRSRGEDLVREMEKQSAEVSTIHKIMAECSSAALIDQTIAALEKIQAESQSRMDQRKKAGRAYSQSTIVLCRKLLETLRELQTSRKIIDSNYLHIAQFEFSKFADDPKLPSVESCILSPSLSARRREMELDNWQLKQVAVQLKNFQTFFRNNNIAQDMKSSLLNSIFDDSVWKNVLDCDCLKLPPPTYSEKNAKGDYDRMLGVYAFWEYLRSIGGEFDTTIFEERFKPDLFKSKEIFNHLGVFLSFCRPHDRLPFYKTMKRLSAENGGKTVFGEYVKVSDDILARRDALIRKMHAAYMDAPDTRRGIIAGGIALCLIPEDGKEFKPADLAEKVGSSLKNLRKRLAKLNEQKQDTTPEQRLSNEKEILEIGIPGDAFLKQPWTDLAGKEKK